MGRLLARRLLGGLFVLWAVHLATFAALRCLPGDPWREAAGERDLPPGAMARLRELYGHDRPLLAQYLDDLRSRLALDFGHSLTLARGEPVGGLLLRAAPVSAGIGCAALLVGLLLGTWAGGWAALRRGRAADHAVRAAATLGISVPDFVLGTALLLALSLALGWLPAGGLAHPGGLVLPALTLGLPLAAAVARLVRSSLAEELAADFARTARAKGAGETRVLLDHALRPAFGPVAAYLAQAAAHLLTGSMVVESLFALPGLGFFFVAGAVQQDWTVVSGAALAYAALLAAFNLAADLCLAWLDPRTR
jgi:oligopeptide transport system permease protein